MHNNATNKCFFSAQACDGGGTESHQRVGKPGKNRIDETEEGKMFVKKFQRRRRDDDLKNLFLQKAENPTRCIELGERKF